jgi:hypothetical protein
MFPGLAGSTFSSKMPQSSAAPNAADFSEEDRGSVVDTKFGLVIFDGGWPAR